MFLLDTRERIPPAKSIHHSHQTTIPRRDRGYSILVVCFLVAITMVAATAAVPNLVTENRREKEEELIWRGEQYARAVRLFYRKNGRFPQSFEDLTEPKNNIRYLRKAYADPMNLEDGSWRLIYIGPSGQLIGSTTRSAFQGFSFGQQQTPGGPAKQAGPGPQDGKAPTTPSPGTPPPTLAKAPDSSERLFGGNIIGVASKIEKSSIKEYKGASNYRQWEFIWDPTTDRLPGTSVPGVPGQPQQGAPGSRPPGGQQGAPRPRQP